MPTHFEDDLKKEIAATIKSYAKARDTEADVSTFAPASSQQSSVNQNKYCYDLAVSISRSRVLILEIKYMSAEDCDTFHHLPTVQHEQMLRLEEHNIPIYYTYNIACDYADTLGRFYPLLCCLSSEPARLINSNKRILKGDHTPLINLVEEAFFTDAGGFSIQLQHLVGRPLLAALTTSFLLCAFDAINRKILVLEAQELEKTIKGYHRHITPPTQNTQQNINITPRGPGGGMSL